jgi:alkanesulfonate monooxygenase SsuD/methylene tetrahydromethanopterin reductase-like flavin-dependent oxidoreductase (luciferase family)
VPQCIEAEHGRQPQRTDEKNDQPPRFQPPRTGTAAQFADMLEEEFEAGGSRGGFMIVHPQAVPRELLNVVDLLVAELQRRVRFREADEGETLKENLLAR